MSARPAPQPCVSVLVVQEIQETVFNMCVITSAQKWRILKISSAIPIPKQAQQTSPKPLWCSILIIIIIILKFRIIFILKIILIILEYPTPMNWHTRLQCGSSRRKA